MATNPSTLPENVGRITAPSADYPYGSAKDDSTGTTGDGTPIREAVMNDTYGFQQALLNSTGIVPSENSDNVTESQYLQAIVEQAQGRASYMIEDGTSAADAYVVIPNTNNMGPQSYFIGQTILFDAAAANTGAATLALFGLAAKSIKTSAGADPGAGEIDGLTKVEYDGTNFVLQKFTVSLPAGSAAIAVSSDDTTLGRLEDKLDSDGTITFTTINPGANEIRRMSVPNLPSSGQTINTWVAFNGTGVVSIYDSNNVSSITDLGTGNYRINYTTSLLTTNYGIATAGGQADNPADETVLTFPNSLRLTTSVNVRTTTGGGASLDPEYASIIIVKN